MIQKAILERRKDDPLANFVPHKKQQEFIDAILKDKTKMAFFFASNRAGKSDAGAYVGATLARFGMPATPHFIKDSAGATISVEDRATSGWVVSLDLPTSRDVIQPKYFDNGVALSSHKPFIPEREIKEWRVSDQLLILKNGSVIGFKNTESPRIKFQGTEKDWIHFDEEPPKGHYEECLIRVGRKPLRVFATCTLLPPEGQAGGVSWMYNDVIQLWQAGKMPHAMLFSASIYDNPNIGKDEIRLLESIYTEGTVQRQIRLDGEWVPGLSGARCYPNFNRARHVAPQPEWNPRLPLCWCLDFNVAPFVTVVGQRDGQMFRFYTELVLEEGNHSDMADLFHEKFKNHRGEVWLYGDATGKRRSSQTGMSDYTLILNSLRKQGRSAKMKIPEVNPPVSDRINAVQRQLRDEHGVANVSVDPSCEELIADFEQVLRDSSGGIKKSRKANDSYYRRTHSSDGAGYWIAYESPVANIIEAKRKSMGVPIPTPGYGFAR